jgi:hypothetical protein
LTRHIHRTFDSAEFAYEEAALGPGDYNRHVEPVGAPVKVAISY